MKQDVQGSKDRCDCTEQLNEHVERWTRSVFEGIANGIADHAGLMGFALLAKNDAGSIQTVKHLSVLIHAKKYIEAGYLRVDPDPICWRPLTETRSSGPIQNPTALPLPIICP